MIGEEPSFPTQISAVPQFVDYWLWFILKYENFLSEGSLISLLGAHFGAPVRFHGPDLESSEPTFFSFDQFCEIILLGLSNYELSVRSSDGSALVAGYGVRHIRKILDFMRQHKGHFTFTCSRVVNSSFPVNPDDYSFGDLYSPELQSEPYNYFRCIAYQLINAHYFTNDKIDYINTAELYRQFISSLIKDHDSLDYTFTFNGVSTQYDYLSGFYVNIYLNHYLESDFGDSDYDSTFYPLISAIFGYNYSLRYMDYFVGARPRNLAVGDTSVRVQNNTVQVVDVTKNIVKQRFLNAVGRIGNTIEEYSDKILGRRLEYDYHNPKYLFSFDADVFTSEVENTADAQQEKPNSVTAVMRGSFKNHQFTFSIDRYSCIMLIEYTDFPRFYYTTQERMTMAIDRFDMFVPELQYVGDQELRLSELYAGADKEEPFAYQLRDMQFKQAYDECAGGFVDFLPGWLFKFDPFDRSYSEDPSRTPISPAFVRSQPTELDDFYLSLTNLSLAGYFHFIEMWDIKVSAKRPMAYAPEIL